MRLRTSASSSPPAALALARGVGVSVAEAKALLHIERVMPVQLDLAAAQTLKQSLEAAGVTVELVEAPPASARCGAHPRLTADYACAACRAPCCSLCIDGRGQPRCFECGVLEAKKRRGQRLRLVPLSLVLVVVLGAGYAVLRERTRRAEWRAPLRVQVVLASTRPLSAPTVQAWQTGLGELEAWFSAEAARYGVPLPRPVTLKLATPIERPSLPTPPPASDSWLEQTQRSLAFRAQLEALAPKTPDADVQLIVALRPSAASDVRWVEGTAEAFGRVGLVLGHDTDDELGLELCATAHELLHLVGAPDAYDADGHAMEPQGLAEPDAEPRYPQRFAEVMVGEVPEAPAEGRVPRALDEVRLGPFTANAIGWAPAR